MSESFSILKLEPNWDNLRNVDIPGISATEFQPMPNVEASFNPPDVYVTPDMFNHPWKPTRIDGTHITINAGTAAGGPATIGGTSLVTVPAPQLEVSATDLVYVYLIITYTLDIDTLGAVLSGTVVSRVITAETSEQTDTDTDRYWLLFTWQAGKVLNQVKFWNFETDVADNGYAVGTPYYTSWAIG